MSIKGTKTEQNLLTAFAGESQAKNRYTFFAKQAREEGYEQIASIFEETAHQEEQHAKLFFRYLEGGMVQITASYPAGIIDNTQHNLEAAAEGEHEEWAVDYPAFAKIAKEEGFQKIAQSFLLVAAVEKRHEARYRKLYDNMISDNVFSAEEKTEWACRNCGFVHSGINAPEMCPCCQHPKSYFELKATNF